MHSSLAKLKSRPLPPIEKLCVACGVGDLETVSTMVIQQPGLSQGRNRHGVTALIMAVQHGHVKVVHWLLTMAHADPNQGTAWNNYPIHIAVWTGNIEMIDLLRSNGADLEKQSTDGRTALHFAATRSDLQTIVHVLFWARANPDATTVTGDTALHMASEQGSCAMVELLRRADASFNLENCHGLTPWNVAKSLGKASVLVFLEILGARPATYKPCCVQEVIQNESDGGHLSAVDNGSVPELMIQQAFLG